MGLPYSLMVAGIVVLLAVGMYRRQQVQGIKPNWSKTIVTALGTVFVCILGAAVLIAGLTNGYDTIGEIAAFVIVFGGLAALIILVNRRWPLPSNRDKP